MESWWSPLVPRATHPDFFQSATCQTFFAPKGIQRSCGHAFTPSVHVHLHTQLPSYHTPLLLPPCMHR